MRLNSEWPSINGDFMVEGAYLMTIIAEWGLPEKEIKTRGSLSKEQS